MRKTVWIVLMTLFTPLTGMALNYDVFAAQSILLTLVWTAVLLAPYVVTRKRGFYTAAATLLFLDGLVNLFHWIILKCPLNASSIFVFLNTNWGEASEFMTVKATPLLLLLLPYVALFVMALRNAPPFTLRTKGQAVVWTALWLFATVFFADNLLHGRFLRRAVPDVEKALVSFAAESKEYSNLKSRALFPVEARLTTTDPTLVVVIIGESCNRNHLSLYGYKRPTTPRLQSRGDILAFSNVVSANSNTLRSVLGFLSENNAEHSRPLDSALHIFDLLHSSPYRSFWLSNQSPIGLWDNGVTSLARNADVVSYVNLTANSSMESTTIAAFDQQLFAPFLSALADTARHKAVFLHLMGSHTSYDKRYPSRFAHFKGGKDKRARTIDAYDNTILYNDYIVDSLLCTLASYCTAHPTVRATALYFSDHGENVFDEGDYAGHDYSGAIPHANVEIPFLLWLSPSQREHFRASPRLRLPDAGTPYMLDDLFHTLIDLADIATPAFDSTRSFVNAHFDASRPRRLEDGNLYLQ